MNACCVCVIVYRLRDGHLDGLSRGRRTVCLRFLMSLSSPRTYVHVMHVSVAQDTHLSFLDSLTPIVVRMVPVICKCA